MITVTIQIGNSDDKLSQGDWNRYVATMQSIIDHIAHDIQFSGGSSNWLPWQNYCWVITVSSQGNITQLNENSERVRKRFNQDSVAVTTGTTEFV